MQKRLILPGVGSFDHGMSRLMEMGIQRVIDRRVRVDGVPVLGICLGMQLMTSDSEEGSRRTRLDRGENGAFQVRCRSGGFEDSAYGLEQRDERQG